MNSANTATNGQEAAITLESLQEAVELVKAFATPQAPPNCHFIQLQKGVSIWKSEYLPAGTIAVSKDIFDMIFAASHQNESSHG